MNGIQPFRPVETYSEKNNDQDEHYDERYDENYDVKNIFKIRYKNYENVRAEKGLHMLFCSMIAILVAAVFMSVIPLFTATVIAVLVMAGFFVYSLVGRFMVGRDVKMSMVSFVFYLIYVVLYAIRSGKVGAGINNVDHNGFLKSDAVSQGDGENTKLIFIGIAVLVVLAIALITFWVPIGKELKKNNKSAFVCYLALSVGIITECFYCFFMMTIPPRMGAVDYIVSLVAYEYCSKRIVRTESEKTETIEETENE